MSTKNTLRKSLLVLGVLSTFNIAQAQVAREIASSDRTSTNSANADELSKEYYKLKNSENISKRGEKHYYEGESRSAIQFPVGGIGTGCIQYDGDATPRFWQIFNNMTHDVIDNSFMAIRIKTPEGVTMRTLQCKAVGEIQGMKSVRVRGEFPFIDYIFEDDLPVEVTLRIYNPFIPLNQKDSGIPAAFYQVTVESQVDYPIEVDLLASQQNAVGFSRVREKEITEDESFAQRYQICLNRELVDGNKSDLYGGNVNKIVQSEKALSLIMESDEMPTEEHYGQMALMILGKNTKSSYTAQYKNRDQMVEKFKKTGELDNKTKSNKSPKGMTHSGALSTKIELKPKSSKTIKLALAWYFPNGMNGGVAKKWDAWGNGRWIGEGNQYANHWANINELSEYIVENNQRLYSQSKQFQRSFYQSNLPLWLLDRLANQLSILKSRTIFHDKSGYVGLWEGAGAADGSCAGNCNHVWHYAQAHARLFPDFAKNNRESSYGYIKEDGQLPYRHPAGSPAFDGQCGEIIATYREHLISSDQNWLQSQYPAMKKAMEYLIQTWDNDRDGWLSGSMHTTYDCSMSGNPSFLASLYLTALRASAQMAKICQDAESEKQWSEIAQKAHERQNKELWNGEYFIQIPDTLSPANDYANGCHTDQLLGQWWANQLGLGELYDSDKIESATNAILDHNFQATLKYHKQAPRSFTLVDEPGLIVTTWKDGERPKGAPGYSDEAWASHEYNLAAMLIEQNQIDDALAVLYAGYKRYDGKLREGFTDAWGNFGFTGNPFGDDECGQFYSRSLCNWSVLLAMQGFQYNGSEAQLKFSPKWKPENHTSFFTTAQGWGNFSQREGQNRQINTLVVGYGTVELKQLELDNLSGVAGQKVKVRLNRKIISSRSQIDQNTIILEFDELTLKKRDKLTIEYSH